MTLKSLIYYIVGVILSTIFVFLCIWITPIQYMLIAITVPSILCSASLVIIHDKVLKW